MNDLSGWLLWGDRGKLARSMGENFRGENAQLDIVDVTIGLAIVTGLAMALLVLSKYVARRERARRTFSPRDLFKQLCQAHQLERSECKALWRLAQQDQLEHPARLFLEPERFDRPGTAVDADRETYRRLRSKLFDATLSHEHKAQ
jgi:hypothetical protein